jgi:hypothetical protein
LTALFFTLEEESKEEIVEAAAEVEVESNSDSVQLEVEVEQKLVDNDLESREDFDQIEMVEEEPKTNDAFFEVEEESEDAANRLIDLTSSIGDGNWIEREVIGISGNFDPDNIADRFITIVETRQETSQQL